MWVKGYYEMAKLQLEGAVLGQDNEIEIIGYLEEIMVKNGYRGLPELTNEDGRYCKDSCSTQAWSGGTLLEYFYKKQKMKQQK